jgi:hypothetical protein
LNLVAARTSLWAGLSRPLSLDNNRRNIVVLEIALHERPGGMVETIRDIRGGIVAQGANLVMHTLGAELVASWRG